MDLPRFRRSFVMSLLRRSCARLPADPAPTREIAPCHGAFTEQIVQRRKPAEVQGVDPSAAQVAYAQARPGAMGAVFQVGG
jgi:hypothetical protein